MICDYGCGQKARFFFKNGKKCCSTHFSKCPTRIKKFSGKNNPMYDKDPWNKGKVGVYSEETLQKMRDNSDSLKGKTYEEIYGKEKAEKLKKIRAKELSKRQKGKPSSFKGKIHSKKAKELIRITHTYTIHDYKNKYPEFYELERPIFKNDRIYIKCKHCKKLFHPSRIQLTERLRSIGHGIYKSFFYCSQNCKNDSEFFNRKVDPTELEEFKKYSSLVWIYTNHTLKKHNIKNIELRGRNKLHLDHKYSIREGFNNNINPKILANRNNLCMIPEEENIRKGSSCSITLDELLSFK